MCGRFTLTGDPSQVDDEFAGVDFPAQFAPRYNIAPSQPVLTIANDGKNVASFMVWGLIPSWAKEPSIGSRLINARGETIAEKPSFKNSFKYKRCLILADGFFEWKSQGGGAAKIPYFVHLKSRRPFALAGLWAEWHGADAAPTRTCTIVTTAPNELMASIHTRMPVILQANERSEWIDPSPRLPDSLAHLIRPLPTELMQAYPVSTLVNSPANDRAECILPA
jgi:putative SOS response-associated peptidase YedK